jgi:hypothetical protein
MTYCNSTDCPYTDCEKHQTHLKGGFYYYADIDRKCKKYMKWLAYSNYGKYRELKEKNR